ncbi:MAG: DUF2102 domain-containing protein, partial [Candidatus Methanomethyliaceae archaeon]|nr:DUF2102 domain-containing protein [Candidatus Methanomethyliaceae archaeon]
IKELKEMDPNRIFVKARGFRIGDERICRAKMGGGPRPGFFMLGLERSVLGNVAKALESAEEVPGKKERKKLNYELLKKIVEEA